MPPEKCKHCECYRGIGDCSSIITTCCNSSSFAASKDRCPLHWYVMQPGQPCKIYHSLTCGWHALDSKACALLTSLTVCVLVLQRIVLRVLNIWCLLAVAVRVVLGLTVLGTIFALRLQVSSLSVTFSSSTPHASCLSTETVMLMIDSDFRSAILLLCYDAAFWLPADHLFNCIQSPYMSIMILRERMRWGMEAWNGAVECQGWGYSALQLWEENLREPFCFWTFLAGWQTVW